MEREENMNSGEFWHTVENFFFFFQKEPKKKKMLEIKDKSEKKKIFQWTYQHDTAEERIDKLKISQQKVLRLKHKK